MSHEVLGANTIAEMMALDAEMRTAHGARADGRGRDHLPAGDFGDRQHGDVGADTIIEPFVQLLGRTTIGSDCRIRSYSVIEDSTIGDDVLVRNGSIISRFANRRRAR